jgi:acyl-CoA thioesterase-2
MQAPAEGTVEELLELLNLQTVGQGTFLGPPALESRNRVFGGQVIAQALAAACFTVDGFTCHSLHGYFLRPGKPGRPIEYEVSAPRDGQNFAVRKVIAVQRDEPNFELIASFQRDEPGGDYQPTMPETPPPESFPSEEERIAKALEQAPKEAHEHIRRKRPIEAIRVDARGPGAPPGGSIRTWMRARGKLIDDPNLHRAVLGYASDMGALEPSLRALGTGFGDGAMQVASLDHALWFHRPFRIDDWLLFVFESASVAGGRGLSHGRVFDRQGRLVASIAQEGVMRKRDEQALI